MESWCPGSGPHLYPHLPQFPSTLVPFFCPMASAHWPDCLAGPQGLGMSDRAWLSPAALDRNGLAWKVLHWGPAPALPPRRSPGWACSELRGPSCYVETSPRAVPGSWLPKGTFHPLLRLSVAGIVCPRDTSVGPSQQHPPSSPPGILTRLSPRALQCGRCVGTRAFRGPLRSPSGQCWVQRAVGSRPMVCVCAFVGCVFSHVCRE